MPLSDAALAILEKIEVFRIESAGAPAFPGLRGKPLSDMTLAKALKTAGAGAYTVHGFRSSFRDWAAETTGTPGDVVEAALAHTVANRVEAAYRRTNYVEKHRRLMDAWARYLGTKSANVVHIRPALNR